jgi:transcriptional antiterminator RfaH
VVQKSDKKWFIAQVKPNCYDLASINLQRQGISIFMPKIKYTERKENKFKVKEKHLFPGYIFVNFNPFIFTWTKINNTYGVSKILVFNKKPAEISTDFVLELMSRYSLNRVLSENKNLKEGDTIKIDNGPFADLIAKVHRVKENNRIWVLLEYMGGIRKLKLKKTPDFSYNKVLPMKQFS